MGCTKRHDLCRFPTLKHRSWSTHFPANMADADFGKVWNSVSWYSKIPWIAGLEQTHVRNMFTALPQIIQDFRDHITIAAVDPELRKRIDKRYIEAYKQIG